MTGEARYNGNVIMCAGIQLPYHYNGTFLRGFLDYVDHIRKVLHGYLQTISFIPRENRYQRLLVQVGCSSRPKLELSWETMDKRKCMVRPWRYCAAEIDCMKFFYVASSRRLAC